MAPLRQAEPRRTMGLYEFLGAPSGRLQIRSVHASSASPTDPGNDERPPTFCPARLKVNAMPPELAVTPEDWRG